MKLYQFDPDDYGMHYVVLAENDKQAIEALNTHLAKQREQSLQRNPSWTPPLEQWGDDSFRDYKIRIRPLGHVIEIECS